MSRMITFVCDAPGHSKAKPERGSQILTIHEGRWAVCPAGRDDGHIWTETPGINYDEMFVSYPLRKNAS